MKFNLNDLQYANEDESLNTFLLCIFHQLKSVISKCTMYEVNLHFGVHCTAMELLISSIV